MQFSAVLLVAFVLSVGAGALIGRQQSAPPAASVPTPTPVLPTTTASPPTATASPPPPTTTTAPTPTPSPLPPTVPPTAPPTVPPTAPPTLDPPTAEDFAGDLLAAFQTDDDLYLFDRLHPLVFERYGERPCRRYLNGLPPDPNASWTVLSSSGPAPWDWETDDLTTTVPDTWTVTIEIPDEGQREVHFAPFEGPWRWFVDCGNPL